MIAIPAIDLIDGSVVRLSEGDYSTAKSYGSNPAEFAKMIQDAGLSHLHLVDLDGAKGDGERNLHVLEEIASATDLIIDFGGGIRKLSDVEAAFSAGADAVNVGSAAAKSPVEVLSWAERWPDRIILSADSRKGLVAVSGWLETTSIPLIPFIERFVSCGLRRAVVTDIAQDGMLSGPSVDLYKDIIDSLPSAEIIASGGVSSRKDLETLRNIGCYGAIVGKAIYEGYITLKELKEAEC